MDDGQRGSAEPTEPDRPWTPAPPNNWATKDRKDRRTESASGGSQTKARDAASNAGEAYDRPLAERASHELAATPAMEAIRLKRPADWTEGEMRSVMRGPGYWRGVEPDRRPLQDGVAGWFAARYGTEPQRLDATGRLIEPALKDPAPSDPVEPTTADGEPLSSAVGAIADALGRAGGRSGSIAAVTQFQRGLKALSHGLRETAGRSAQSPRRREPDAGARFYREAEERARPKIERLKEDGVFGPKTARATRAAAAIAGRKPVERLAAGEADRDKERKRESRFGPPPLAGKTDQPVWRAGER